MFHSAGGFCFCFPLWKMQLFVAVYGYSTCRYECILLLHIWEWFRPVVYYKNPVVTVSPAINHSLIKHNLSNVEWSNNQKHPCSTKAFEGILSLSLSIPGSLFYGVPHEILKRLQCELLLLSYFRESHKLLTQNTACLNTKMSYKYRNSHYKDKMVWRPSYLYYKNT